MTAEEEGQLHITAYGAAAAQQLATLVAHHKAGDPLRPVSVIVPANSVGVATRRRLAADAGGIAAVNFLTVYRMAELLGAPRLSAAQRRPVSTPILTATVRSILASEPGVFAAVAEHAATEDALVRAHRDLSELSEEALREVERAGRRAHDVVRVHRALRSRLAASWFEERDLMEAAIEAIHSGSPVLRDLGAVVVYLPQRLGTPGAAMLRTAATRTPLSVIAGSTGDTKADAAVARCVERLGFTWSPPRLERPHGTNVISASDADEEVRAVVRAVVAAARDGVPLHRIAVLYGHPVPYARLLHEELTAAGITYNGTAVRTLTDCVLARGLLQLLSLPDRDFRRPDVMALGAATPLRFRGRLAPVARWELISRKAGVVATPARWITQLDGYAAAQREELLREQAVTDREPHTLRYEITIEHTEALRDFMGQLAGDLDPARLPTSWSGLASWALRLIRQYFGDEQRRQAWPEHEQRAAGLVDAAIERLATLDEVESAPTLEVFRRTLAAELDTDLGRTGRLGEGVLAAPIAFGLGLDLERVFVLGLAEGVFPVRRRDDSLLPDEERARSDGELTLTRDRAYDDHRLLLAALAATTGTRTLTWPRGDLRGSTDHVPSRFLLDTVEVLRGARPHAGAIHELHESWYAQVPSFIGGVARTTFPATEQQHRVRALLDEHDRASSIAAHPLVHHDRALALAHECAVARRGTAFTRFDGNVTSHASLLKPLTGVDGQLLSASRLETWAKCPFDYFMQYVLRVEVPDVPEEVFSISPLDKGSLIHEVLEKFVDEALDNGVPHGVWPVEWRARLLEIGAAHCDSYQQRGLTGRAIFWRRERAMILRDFARWIDEDHKQRGGHGYVPVAVEQQFGMGAVAGPLAVLLADGRGLRFRGAIDRIDRATDGSARLRVIDYKTGKSDAYQVTDADPDQGGTRLQLPLYARAARAHFGATTTDVEGCYWFCSNRGDWKVVTLACTPAVDERFDLVLCTIVDGIEAGIFPAALDDPGSWERRRRSYLDPDGLGTRERFRQWQRVAGDPLLDSYRSLSTP